MKAISRISATVMMLLLSVSLMSFNWKAVEGEKEDTASNTTVVANAAVKSVYLKAEVMPKPAMGTMGAFNTYIRESARYPQAAREKGIEGKLYVGFIVNNDGTVSNVKVLKGLGAGCDEEAVRLIENASGWIPGQQNGKNVNVQMILPITFKLDW